MSSLKDYLAKNYGKSSHSSSQKKKKTESSSLKIVDFLEFPEPEQEKVVIETVSWKGLSEIEDVERYEEKVERGRRKSPSLSPELQRRKSPSISPTRQEEEEEDQDVSIGNQNQIDQSHPRMSNGTKAGLQTSESIKRDLERMKQEQQLAYQKNPVQEAPTIYRDASGRKINIQEEKALELEKKKKEQEEEEARMEWGKGIKQNRDAKKMAERLKVEENAPLAVYVDDKDRNEELRERDRWGDPMAHLVSKPSTNSSTSLKKKVKSRMMYRGPPAPPNRFGILPVNFIFRIK